MDDCLLTIKDFNKVYTYNEIISMTWIQAQTEFNKMPSHYYNSFNNHITDNIFDYDYKSNPWDWGTYTKYRLYYDNNKWNTDSE